MLVQTGSAKLKNFTNDQEGWKEVPLQFIIMAETTHG